MKTLMNALIGLPVIAFMMAWPMGAAAGQQGSSGKVEYYPHQQVAAAFAKGQKLLQASSGRAVYQVFTARRDGPGEVELHTLDTDIVYVVKGTATFVTGGKIVDARHISATEVRGKAIQGGTPHHLTTEQIARAANASPRRPWSRSPPPPRCACATDGCR